MRRLSILRHAKSSWDDPRLDDFDRPLNERGRRAAKRMAIELQRRGIAFDLVLASTATRVRQTVDWLRDELDLSGSVQFDERIYLAEPRQLLALVRELPESVRGPLLVGHNPGLQELLLELTGNNDAGYRERVARKFPTAAFAAVDLPARWCDVEPGSGRIVELILPGDLD